MSIVDLVVNAVANNDTALEMLARGENPAPVLYRACRWHVMNGDAEWADDDQTICVITEQGKETFAAMSAP